MAVQTGSATDHNDLFDKLIDFLTTDSVLVGDLQNWEIVWTAPGGAPNETAVVLRGPGLAEQDQVYIGLSLSETTPGDSWAIDIHGMSGFLEDATILTDHVNVSQGFRMFLDVNAMDYWFVANGRRFMVVARMSTVYEAMYAGLFLPYASPLSYPYPLFVGGTYAIGSAQSVLSWRDTTNAHSQFFAGFYNTAGTSYLPTAAILDPMGTWQRVSGQAGIDAIPCCIGPKNFGADSAAYQSHPTSGTDFTSSYGYNDMLAAISPDFDGNYLLTPFTLFQHSPAPQTFGILQDAYHITGRGNAAGNIVAVDGVDHLVVQNLFRLSSAQYWAMRLE